MSSGDKNVELLQGTLDLIILRALSTMGPLHSYALATGPAGSHSRKCGSPPSQSSATNNLPSVAPATADRNRTHSIPMQLFRSTSGVDPNRIIVLGHSLGGMLMPRIAAAGPPVACFVVMAGAARPIPQAVIEQARYLAQVDGVISADEQAQISQIEQMMARVDALGPKDASNPERIFAATASYWLDLRGYDPPAAAAQVKQPMLVLQGERDYQVTMEEFSRWKSALGHRTDVVFHSYATLNHLFVAGTGKSVPAEYNSRATSARPSYAISRRGSGPSPRDASTATPARAGRRGDAPSIVKRRRGSISIPNRPTMILGSC